MKRSWQHLVGSVVLGLLIAGISFAQEGPAKKREGRPGGRGIPSVDKIFERLDTNQDGKLTADELTGPMGDRLKQADTDSDAAVTKEELEAARKKMAAGRGGQGPGRLDQMFQRLDKDGDGKLSESELPPQLAQRLKKADADGDGSVSKEEMEKARAEMGPGAGQRPGGPQAGQLFQRLDGDGDGKLSGDEIPERMKERLSKIDSDQDGVVTKAEFEEAHKKLQQHRRGPEGQRPAR